jgi:RsiW-degrading membrane proteinase PrsW (M82 family)
LDQRIFDLIILLAVAFIPSLIYLVWIRNAERYGREPYGRLLRIFIFGAVISVAIAVIFEFLLMALVNQNMNRVYEVFGNDPNLSNLIIACIVAPLVEEMAKGLGVFRSRRFMSEIEDGIVFGAAAGLGFAATENLLYESSTYFTDGTGAFITIAVIRSLSSALLHASASSVFGLGISRSALQGRSWFLYYMGAVTMHGVFNLAASFGSIYEKDIGPAAYLIGLAAAFVIAIIGIFMVRSKIRSLDDQGSGRVRRR